MPGCNEYLFESGCDTIVTTVAMGDHSTVHAAYVHLPSDSGSSPGGSICQHTQHGTIHSNASVATQVSIHC